MSHYSEFMENFMAGIPIFEKLFALPYKELLAKVQTLCGDQIPNTYILIDGHVVKTTTNDRPDEIRINFYDSITISPLGITYIPEHGNGRLIFDFGKYAKLATL